MTDEIARDLEGLGFTSMEAAAYVFLVGHSPATGYSVAQGIGKAVANTYKALEALQRKGAVLVDETGTRMCRAVPPNELIRQLRSAHESKCREVGQSLEQITESRKDERIFSMTAVDQLFEKCTSMLRHAEAVVVVDAFPVVATKLAPELKRAARRGVRILLQAYAPIDLPGVEVVIAGAAVGTHRNWNGAWVSVVADGAEYLFAYLDSEGKEMHQGIWTSSTALAWLQHANLAYATRAVAYELLIDQEAPLDAFRKLRRRSNKFFNPNLEGFRKLKAKLPKD